MTSDAQQNNPEIVGILLAAGQGQRFGGNKCLAPLPNGLAMGLQTARNLQLAVDRMICIVRPEDLPLQELFTSHQYEVVPCHEAHLGMSASLKAGLLASQNAEGWLVMLADMPLIKSTTCQLLAEQLQLNGGIVRPQHADKPGHPVGFAREFLSELLTLQGDEGARKIVKANSNKLQQISVDDPGIHLDFDTKDSLTSFTNFAQF